MTLQPPTFQGIDHVQIAVPAGSEVACRAFYVDVLGMPEIVRPAEAKRSFLWVGIGAQQVHFRADTDFHAGALAHPAFVVTGLDRLADRIRAAGHDLTTGDAIGPGRFHIRDPFGNRIEFIEGREA